MYRKAVKAFAVWLTLAAMICAACYGWHNYGLWWGMAMFWIGLASTVIFALWLLMLLTIFLDS